MEIAIQDAREGMVLVSDVIDRNGRVLLIAGNPISEKNIKVFKSWGIASLVVKKEISPSKVSTRVATKVDESNGDQVEEQLNHLFRFTDRNHPVIRELFEIALERKRERLSL